MPYLMDLGATVLMAIVYSQDTLVVHAHVQGTDKGVKNIKPHDHTHFESQLDTRPPC